MNTIKFGSAMINVIIALLQVEINKFNRYDLFNLLIIFHIYYSPIKWKCQINYAANSLVPDFFYFDDDQFTFTILYQYISTVEFLILSCLLLSHSSIVSIFMSLLINSDGKPSRMAKLALLCSSRFNSQTNRI